MMFAIEDFLFKAERLLSNQVSRDPGAELWLADIQEAVRRANQQSQRTLKSEFCREDLLITASPD